MSGATMATATKHPHMQDASNGSVRVEIFDQGYNLRGTDPDYILKLAEYVDTKMRAVSQQTHTVDTARLAVLAAINIADEFHMLRKKMDGGTPDSSRRARQLLNALDEVLDERRR
jgi:cell division protein ZapA